MTVVGHTLCRRKKRLVCRFWITAAAGRTCERKAVTTTAASAHCNDRGLVCCQSAVAVGLRISSKKRVRAGLVPGTLWNVALRRRFRIGVIGCVEVCGLGARIVEICSAHGHVEGGGREAAYLKSRGCRVGCRRVLAFAPGRANIARGHGHRDALGRRLLPQKLPEPSVVWSFIWFAVAKAQAQDWIRVVVYDMKYREDEAGSNVRVRGDDEMNLRSFRDSPRPLDVEERFGFRASVHASVKDTRIGSINYDD